MTDDVTLTEEEWVMLFPEEAWAFHQISPEVGRNYLMETRPKRIENIIAARVAAAERERDSAVAAAECNHLAKIEWLERAKGAEREALERAVRAIEATRDARWRQHLSAHPLSGSDSCPRDYGRDDGFNEAMAAVRDLMPRKDGSEDCQHKHVRTFRSRPPHSKCLDCGARVTQRWVAESALLPK